ncbi:unnamed protein product [Clonostachys rosea f. rosea IK726]|uniref:Major facilitator superfamily (MFS) profile domain-containing protein n=2 Tax=Bionectria ochroleuca TaxID=29856 RepID=A0A0B7K9Q0_BIOOC|nr:unnamed protein product [Clonostachys rosea f. rosea IK726]
MPPTQVDVDAGIATMWPPGTVLLEDVNAASGKKEIILQPRPSANPNDPLNWAKWRKYLNFAIVCLYSAMVSEFTSSATPTWGPMQKELGFSDDELNNSYAIGCAFLGIGSVLLIPFALKLGRRPLYLVSTIAQFLVAIWSAKQRTYGDLMGINIVQCGFGALGEVMVQMTIADVFFVHQRGSLNSIYVWLWKVAAPLGSLLAGYVSLSRGWRWVWWGNAIFIGALALIVAFLYEETKFVPEQEPVASSTHPVESEGTSNQEKSAKSGSGVQNGDGIQARTDANTSAFIEEKGSNTNLHEIQVDKSIPEKTYLAKLSVTGGVSSDARLKSFTRHMYQPFILLGTIPAVAFTALVYGILIALGDVISTSISTYMKKPPYSFNSAQIGLMSLPKIIGVTIGCVVGGPLSDWLVVFLCRRNKGVYEPETRLWCFCLFLPLVPAGAILTGIGLGNGLPWPLVALGVVLYNMGISPINSVVLTYLTDSYQNVIGDALVGVTVVRNAFSTAFIFALTPWIREIGITYVFVIILLISVLILGQFAVLLKWGKSFRARCASRYEYYSARQYKERAVE